MFRRTITSGRGRDVNAIAARTVRNNRDSGAKTKHRKVRGRLGRSEIKLRARSTPIEFGLDRRYGNGISRPWRDGEAVVLFSNGNRRAIKYELGGN